MTEQFDEFEATLRLAAEKGNAEAQYELGVMNVRGRDHLEGMRWLLLAAKQNYVAAQYDLGRVYAHRVSMGSGAFEQGYVPDHAEALKWLRLAANNGQTEARKIITELETPTPDDELHEWLDELRTEANKDDQSAQRELGLHFCEVKPQDYICAYLWISLAAAQGDKRAIKAGETIKQRMTSAQIAAAQKLAHEWKPNASSRP